LRIAGGYGTPLPGSSQFALTTPLIEPNDNSADAFVHISAVEQAGLSGLREGQKVEYEVVPGRNGKSSAENLVVSD
jgi:CspA family cold shock protein